MNLCELSFPRQQIVSNTIKLMQEECEIHLATAIADESSIACQSDFCELPKHLCFSKSEVFSKYLQILEKTNRGHICMPSPK